MTVFVPTPLRSYTNNRAEVHAAGSTVGDILYDLDRQFPGMRFRMIDEQNNIRQHIRFFVKGEAALLPTQLHPGDDLQIICAISGGRAGIRGTL